MDMFGILDPDPHKNLCGSETLLQSYWCLLINEYILILLDKFENFLISFIPNIPVRYMYILTNVSIQVQVKDYFDNREELKLAYEEYFEKSLTKKYQPEPQVF